MRKLIKNRREITYKNKLKKILAMTAVASLSISMLAGCGSDGNDQKKTSADKGKVIVTVGDYEVSEEELMLYSILEILSGKVQYEDIQKEEDKYKQIVIDNVVEAKTAGEAAKAAGMEFTKDDESSRDDLIRNFTTYVPKAVRDKYGISDETIDYVFNETSIMNKMETNTRNELGKSLTETAKEKYKDYNFQKIYYLTFPKVKADEDGNPMTDESGKYTTLDKKELEEKKSQAEAAVKEINGGADAKEVAKKYGVDVYSEEKQSFVGGYSDDMNEVMDKLKAGQCTEVFDSETSYYAIAVLSDHDQNLLESFAYQAAEAAVDTALNSEKGKWTENCMSKGGVAYKDDTWKNFSLLDMATFLNEQGLMK